MRITQTLMMNQLNEHLKAQNRDLYRLENQVATQNRIQKPHQDPLNTAKIMHYRSKMGEYSRYEENIADVRTRLNFTDVQLQSVQEYLQNIREFSVQGANGVLTQGDRQAIGMQVEQHLRQIVQIANTQWKGESIFSGFETDRKAYEEQWARSPEIGETILAEVKYRGDHGKQYREIDRGEYIEVNLPGSEVFWATRPRVISQTIGTEYIAESSVPNRPYQNIQVGGVEIRIDDGDNLSTIVDKINASGAPVRAEIDNTTGEDLLILESTRSTALWLEDSAGSTVLQDLGILARGGAYPPNNLSSNALVSGDSLFDAIIHLRDALFSNNLDGVNRGIGDMDQSMDQLLSQIALVGSRQSRMESAENRISQNQLYAHEIYSKIQGLDLAEAITELKNWEMAHVLALNMGARTLRPTLMDFLR